MADAPIPIRIPKDLLDKIELAAKLTGLPKQDVMRLGMRIGVERLRRIDYNIESAILDASEQPASNVRYADFITPPQGDSKVAEH